VEVGKGGAGGNGKHGGHLESTQNLKHGSIKVTSIILKILVYLVGGGDK